MFQVETLKESRDSTNIEFIWWGKSFVVLYFNIQDNFESL